MARDDLPRGDLRRAARGDAPRRDACSASARTSRAFGGAFKVTDGFVEEFGAERVIDTPLAENAIIGTAVGAAIEGMRPVCEMQFADFISCGFDQLVNVAAKMHYRQGIAVPMVVRLPSGGGFSGGPFHSQNPEAWFLQAPGPEGGRAGDRGRRQGPARQRDPGPEPGLLPRAQGALPPREGRGPRGGAHGTELGRGARRARGRGADRGRLRLRRRARRGSGRGARRGHRGDRPAQPLPARRRRDRSPASRRPARCWSPTRRRARAGWAPRSPRSRRARSSTSTRRCGGSPRPTCRSRSARRSEQAILPQLDDMKEACRELLAY